MIDAHVHIVGNGIAGSGCKLKLSSPFHKLLARYILSQFNLPPDPMNPELDELYINKLLEMVRDSSFQKIIILAHENAYDNSGNIIPNFGSLYVPNEYVLNLAKNHNEFLAAVSIHPARKDALEELEKSIELGAVMMKCLPNCQNIDCSDRRYVKFWNRMADAKMPLLAHTGGELSLPVFNKAFEDPRLLELPLQCGVNVIAAHCATSSFPFKRNYLPEFISMLERFPNLYGDNSGMMTPYRSRHFAALLKEPIISRIINGSDLPIPIAGYWTWIRGDISRKQLKLAHQDSNILRRDYELKNALGFPKTTFTKISELICKNSAR